MCRISTWQDDLFMEVPMQLSLTQYCRMPPRGTSHLSWQDFIQTQCSLDHNVSRWQVSTWLWNAGEGGVWAWILSDWPCPTVTKAPVAMPLQRWKMIQLWLLCSENWIVKATHASQQVLEGKKSINKLDPFLTKNSEVSKTCSKCTRKTISTCNRALSWSG